MPDLPMFFDPRQQSLNGKFTIEASAGTGKTYSIALLVVRLILMEKPVEKILLVTFTEAAAAELKERAVKFIRLALMEMNSPGSNDDENIRVIIQNCNLSTERKKELLNKALLDIDKSSMCTIHSFCQQTLNEFAFETNQVFGKELMTDVSEIVKNKLNDYWRNHVVSGDKTFLEYLDIADKQVWKQAIENKMQGKKFPDPLNNFENREQIEIILNELKDDLIADFDNKIEDLRNIIRSYQAPRYQRSNALSKLQDSETLFNYLKGESLAFNFNELLQTEIEQVRTFQKRQRELIRGAAHYYLNRGAEIIIPEIRQDLDNRFALTFDDLIKSLYKVKDDPRLTSLIRNKYDAVFVDEFQDTDQFQYGIFKSFFQDSDNTILFFIGDPKQSIYAWRQADPETYLMARDSRGMQRLIMNTNYRSSKRFIDASNSFFTAVDPAESCLEYVKVNAKPDNNKPGISFCDSEHKPFPAIHLIKNLGNNESLITTFRQTIKLLFSKELTLNGNPIEPSNVAILVRTGIEGKTVKNILSGLKIPSVLHRDESIFSTQEARELKEILNAVINISKSNIDRALMTDLIGYSVDSVHSVRDEFVIPFFYDLKSLWENEGIFVVYRKIDEVLQLTEKWRTNITIGHQKLSNTNQIIDILQKATLNESLSPSEVLEFLSEKIQNGSSGEEHLQGIESDQLAVQIMTIHKSKGLEFDIVLLPFLSLVPEEKGNFTSYRKKVHGNNEYFFERTGLTDNARDLFEEQARNENERLLYVALTRARFNAFIFSKTFSASNPHLLFGYIRGLESVPGDEIKIMEPNDLSTWGQPTVRDFIAAEDNVYTLQFPTHDFADKNYHKLSYSFLAGSHGSTPKSNISEHDESSYDQFVFKDLPKGAHIGNLLHNIFEFIDFTNDEKWNDQIALSIQRFTPGKKNDAQFSASIRLLVEHTLKAPIKTEDSSFNLNQISREKRINELEFNFPVKKEFRSLDLEYLFDQNDPRVISTVKSSVRGMMNGLVDLFFEFDGKYYILDWKSNFLGDRLEDYTPSLLTEAMNENNYHLQYMLYTLAVEKYIISRKGGDFDFEKHFGGVIYLFLRGIRETNETGIYIQRPTIDQREKMREIILGQ